jgi:membrane protein required for colicin V production
MNWADWTIVGILTVSCLIGLKRGLVKEALSLVVWLAAFFVAVSFREPFSQLLSNAIEVPSVRELAAFGGLFVATLVVGAMVNYLIGELVKLTGLSGTDRLLGMVFGLARGVVVVMAILILLPQVVPVDQDPWWSASALIPSFLQMENTARQLASAVSEQFLLFLN